MHAPIILVILFTKSLADSSQQVGQCACDLTTNQCDAHCCCDPDCAVEGVSDLKSKFQCLPSGTANSPTRMCGSRDWVHSMRPNTDFWVIADDLRGLLCIEIDNSVVDGRYFDNQARLPASRLETELKRQSVSTWKATQTTPKTNPASTVNSYVIGEQVRIHRAIDPNTDEFADATSTVFQRNFVEMDSNLPVSVPGPFGQCGDAPFGVRFLYDIKLVSCWVDDLEKACKTVLSPTRAMKWLMPRQPLPDGVRCNGTTCLKPNVTVACPKTTGIASTCTSGQASVLQPSSFERGDENCVCRGAIRSTSIIIHYGPGTGGNGIEISGVDVNVEISDVSVSQGCGPVTLDSKVHFHAVAATDKPVWRRSGNPGYHSGLPLIASRCRSPGKAGCSKFEPMSEFDGHAVIQGLLIDGQCARVDEIGSNFVINFQEDAFFGCNIELNRAQLKEVCNRESPTGFSKRYSIFSLPFTHIAAAGNVQPDSQKNEDWVEISFTELKEAPIFTDASPDARHSTCSGASVGLNLEIMYSPFGETNNPQMKVVTARAYLKPGTMSSPSPPKIKQAFQFSATVTFVQLTNSSDPETRVPPRPPFPRLLPYGLFEGSTCTRHGTMPFIFSFVAALLLQQDSCG